VSELVRSVSPSWRCLGAYNRRVNFFLARMRDVEMPTLSEEVRAHVLVGALARQPRSLDCVEAQRCPKGIVCATTSERIGPRVSIQAQCVLR
jgi:hypothetical protein